MRRRASRHGLLERSSQTPPTTRFRAYVFGAATLVIVVGLWMHVMWLDEMQAWLIARDSATLPDLFANLRYEGHPALWHLLLYPLTALGRQPQWMQVAQGLCAIGSLAIIVWKGPFSRLELALLPFGYCLLFEYGVKSRSYSLGTLLLLSFCLFYPRRRSHPLSLAFILALMANVHVLFAIVACVGAATVLLDEARASRPMLTATNALFCAIVLSGLIVAAITALPPADSGFAVGWQTDLSPMHGARTFKALSAFTIEGVDRYSSYAAAVFGVALLGVGVARWRDLPSAVFFFAAASLASIAFIHLKTLPHPWHHGVLFVVLIAAVWIGRLEDAKPGTHGILPRPLFAVVLGLQAIHGLSSVALDVVRPYSNSLAIARYIDRQGWAQSPTYVLDDAAGAAILGYLGTERFYYAEGARWGSFLVFDDQRVKPFDEDAFFAIVGHSRVAATVLDCGLGRTKKKPAAHGLVAVTTIEDSTIGEDCTIYRTR